MVLKEEIKISGKYKLQVIKDDGSIKQDTGWFSNLITNGGLDALGDNLYFGRYCQVGSGNTAPANGDTGLANRIASVDKGGSWCATNLAGAASSSPYYQYQRIVYTFGTGVAAGNISEVGIGWASSGSLYSRALILDINGNPTTITVLSDEQLIVTYEFRFYPIETDTTGSVTFTGNKGGTYAWTLRPAYISTIYPQLYSGYILYYVMAPMNLASGYTYTQGASAGAIAIITSGPNNISSNGMGATPSSYVAGSHTLNLTLTASTAQANIKILSMQTLWGPSCVQIGFNPAIAKTSQDTLSITLTRSWGRY